MLKLDALSVSYGGLRALHGVDLEVRQGELIAVVGPNGAGKSTLFKAISGTVDPDGGQIHYEGQDLLRVPPARRAHLGIAHVPEGRQVFASMTVMENLEMGASTLAGQAKWKENQERIFTLFPQLLERRGQLAGTLSGGEQQMLAIGRGLASAPKLLMLDEPSMGLSPLLADTIISAIQRIHREQGLTVLLVEQRVSEALEACDRGYVLESGRVVRMGSHEHLLADNRIRQAYLGV